MSAIAPYFSILTLVVYGAIATTAKILRVTVSSLASQGTSEIHPILSLAVFHGGDRLRVFLRFWGSEFQGGWCDSVGALGIRFGQSVPCWEYKISSKELWQVFPIRHLSITRQV